MRTFTDENFQGYEFRCTSESANTGFKHVCRVFKDNREVEEAKAVVNWGNRTWESYQYKSVFEESKSRLQDLLDGVQKPEIDFDFLNTLADKGYIFDYGDMEDGETVIIFDSWEQFEGEDEREYVKGQGMIKTGRFIKSVYAKLVELADKNLLKPSINSTIKNVDYVFSDEYEKCWECGTVHNIQYGDLTYVEETGMLLCDKCINDYDNVSVLIEKAKEDIREAVKPTIHQCIIEELGYELVTDETFSFDREFWGAEFITKEYTEDFCKRYDGFVQIYEVAQFVVPFQIWVQKDRIEEAREELQENLNIVIRQNSQETVLGT